MVVDKDTKTDLGNIKIHAEVINSITAIAVTKIKGVVGLHKGAVGKFLQFLGKDFNQSGIKIVFKGNNEVDISVSVIVEYGYDIPKVANFIQEGIKEAVEGTTGLTTGDIDVEVHSVQTRAPDKQQQ